MNKLLQFSVCGVKNIDKEITIELTKQDGSISSKTNHIIGVFGYNGAGKTALIIGMDIYKNVVTNSLYLTNLEVAETIKKLTNFTTQTIRVSVTFRSNEKKVYKHIIEIRKSKIIKEIIYLMNEKNFADKGKTLISIRDGKLLECSLCDSSLLNKIKSLITRHMSMTLSFAMKDINDSENNIKNDEVRLALFMIFDFAYNINICLKEKYYKTINFLNRNKSRNLTKYFLKIFSSDNEKESTKNNINSRNKNALDINKLKKFIRIFKPTLCDIKANELFIKSGSFNDLMFSYDGKNYVAFENESSGIKQLTTIFDSLLKCADGQIAFINEIDSNIHPIYFEKLIEYFLNYGKGQLIFTSQNIEVMDVIKKESRSINNIGPNSVVETWVKNGRRKPTNEYKEGYFITCPLNVEDFDFVNVFEGVD